MPCPPNSVESKADDGSVSCTCKDGYTGDIEWHFQVTKWVGTCSEMGCAVPQGSALADGVTVGDCMDTLAGAMSSGGSCKLGCELAGYARDIPLSCDKGQLTPAVANCTLGMHFGLLGYWKYGCARVFYWLLCVGNMGTRGLCIFHLALLSFSHCITILKLLYLANPSSSLRIAHFTLIPNHLHYKSTRIQSIPLHTANVPCPAQSTSSQLDDGSIACTCDANYQGAITWDFKLNRWVGTCVEKGCDWSALDPTLALGNCPADGLASGEVWMISLARRDVLKFFIGQW